jgi:hypothetical protein
MTYRDGTVYEGAWADNQQQGKATPRVSVSVCAKRTPDHPIRYINNGMYTGNVQNGKPHGEGTYREQGAFVATIMCPDHPTRLVHSKVCGRTA